MSPSLGVSVLLVKLCDYPSDGFKKKRKHENRERAREQLLLHGTHDNGDPQTARGGSRGHRAGGRDFLASKEAGLG